MPHKIRVILITDGDLVAQRVIENIGRSMGLRSISASGGNPTPVSGEEIVALLKQVPYDPVLLMFDDRGSPKKGKGETALEYVASHPDVEVLGALAVASNAEGISGVTVDACISDTGDVLEYSVDKNGKIYDEDSEEPVLYGDTVDVLNQLNIPVIIGIGDIGKMNEADDIRHGAPVTHKAIMEILKRSGLGCQRNERSPKILPPM